MPAHPASSLPPRAARAGRAATAVTLLAVTPALVGVALAGVAVLAAPAAADVVPVPSPVPGLVAILTGPLGGTPTPVPSGVAVPVPVPSVLPTAGPVASAVATVSGLLGGAGAGGPGPSGGATQRPTPSATPSPTATARQEGAPDRSALGAPLSAVVRPPAVRGKRVTRLAARPVSRVEAPGSLLLLPGWLLRVVPASAPTPVLETSPLTESLPPGLSTALPVDPPVFAAAPAGTAAGPDPVLALGPFPATPTGTLPMAPLAGLARAPAAVVTPPRFDDAGLPAAVTGLGIGAVLVATAAQVVNGRRRHRTGLPQQARPA